MTRNTGALTAAVVSSLLTFGSAQAATVYIPEGSAGEVLIVDTETDTAIGRLSGLPDIHGLGGTPRGRYLVAGSFAEGAPDGATAIAKPEGVSAADHAAHHGGAAPSAATTASILTIIDKTDGSTVRRLEVPGAVHHVAVSPDGRYAVATHPNAGGVSVVDLGELSVRGLVRTGSVPNYAAFSPDGSAVYVSNSGNGTVSEIDTEGWEVRRDLPAGERPEHLVVAPDGRSLYVTNVDAGTVAVIALDAGRVSRSIAIGGELHGLDLSDDGGTLFVSGRGENKLVAVDLKSGATHTGWPGLSPYHLTVIPGTGKLYVSSRDEQKIWVVDQASLLALGVIALRGEGHQMVVMP